MTTWKEGKAKLHAGNPELRAEYEKLGPRFAAISELIDARDRMHISQTELARRMNVKPHVISRLESAQHSPLLDTLIAYADALGLEFRMKLVRPRHERTTRALSTPPRRARRSRSGAA